MQKYTSLLILTLLLTAWSCNRSVDKQLAQEAQDANRARQAYKQYCTADYMTAKAALMDFAQYLDRRISSEPPDKVVVYKQDLMFTYVRLAKLEEKNNGSEKAAFMNQAAARCQQLGKWAKCSDQDLRELVDRLDTVAPNP